MLDYVEALSAVPPPSSRKTIEGLRDLGWSDGAILDLKPVAASSAFVNRIAEGLGVELEDSWPDETKADDGNAIHWTTTLAPASYCRRATGEGATYLSRLDRRPPEPEEGCPEDLAPMETKKARPRFWLKSAQRATS